MFSQYERDYVNYALHFSLWHLNSLTEPAYSGLYDKLRLEWFESLGIVAYPPNLFYNHHEYRTFQRMYRKNGNGRPNFITKWADGNWIQRAIKGIYDNGIWYTIEYLALLLLNKRSLYK